MGLFENEQLGSLANIETAILRIERVFMTLCGWGSVGIYSDNSVF